MDIMEWLDGELGRSQDAIVQSINTAQLASTFMTAVAAAVVGTASQIHASTGLTVWDRAAWWAFVVCALLTVLVFLIDRTLAFPFDEIRDRVAYRLVTAEDAVPQARTSAWAVLRVNRTVATRIKVVAWLQTAAAGIAIGLACVSVLGGGT